MAAVPICGGMKAVPDIHFRWEAKQTFGSAADNTDGTETMPETEAFYVRT